MGLLSWVVFGALAGWLASKVMGDPQGRGCLTNIVVGVAGAVLGGAVITLISGRDWVTKFNLPSLAVAIVGAIVLVGLLRAVGAKK
jgi:uncharacterized membrane protein YeaQ/YmgE (transglycosylase-associated protein family)